MSIILAIESSCDETGVALLADRGQQLEVIASELSSQADLHALTGGVIPNQAARAHAEVILPLIKKVLTSAQLSKSGQGIDALAVTFGPGLVPALSVGLTAARTLAYMWQTPLVSVNHLEGHIYSALLIRDDQSFKEPPNTFPALALIVSGGHTQLILVKDHLNYQILGTTLDDAAGEAFDKVARMLDLPYPGGPHLSKLANTGNPSAISLPRPMLNSGDLNFSFSGLKTAVMYELRDNPNLDKADLAASFQAAVVDSLSEKTKQAIKQTQPQTLLLAGGVAANLNLRQSLENLSRSTGTQLRIAPLDLCGDNAIMIGLVGHYAHQNKRHAHWRDLDAEARPSL